MPFIASVTSKVCKRSVQYGTDDELSVAMLGFHDAAASYSAVRGAFLKYAGVVMSRRVIDYLRKENKHRGLSSIHERSDETGLSMEESIADQNDAYGKNDFRHATQQEIEELRRELREMGVSFSDLCVCRPKQERTIDACRKVSVFAVENPELIAHMKRTKLLPIAQICEATGLERKTVERHRKYIIALIIIYSNGYEIIRGHLRQVLIIAKGGRGA